MRYHVILGKDLSVCASVSSTQHLHKNIVDCLRDKQEVAGVLAH